MIYIIPDTIRAICHAGATIPKAKIICSYINNLSPRYIHYSKYQIVNYTNFVNKGACLYNTGIPARPGYLEYRLVDNIVRLYGKLYSTQVARTPRNPQQLS